MLKKIHDQDYGFVKNGAIGINIERLWLEARDETKFIKEFAKTHAHELLHIEIAVALGKKKRAVIGEEKAVRKLAKEPWNKEIEAVYI